jgi:hypothetical protein
MTRARQRIFSQPDTIGSDEQESFHHEGTKKGDNTKGTKKKTAIGHLAQRALKKSLCHQPDSEALCPPSSCSS